MFNSDAILIVGGYGNVGQLIATELKRLGHSKIYLGGRNLEKATVTARNLKCEPILIDVERLETWDTALIGVRTVIVCIDQKDSEFVAYVLNRGLVYIDVTASDDFFLKIEALNKLALEKKGTAILSVGLAPGLTNLLVKSCVEKFSEAQDARIGVLLGLGDKHGSAAFSWTLQQFSSLQPQNISFERISFGFPEKSFVGLPIGFADQKVVVRTLGLKSAKTILAFDPAWQSRAALSLLRFIATRPWATSIINALLPYFHFGSDRTAISVETSGIRNGKTLKLRATLDGHKEAEITAFVAALVVHHSIQNGVKAGVHHIENQMSIENLIPHLTERGVKIYLDTVEN